MTIADERPVSRALTNAEKGVVLAVMAHLVWGGMAVYFGLIRYISPVEIAVNRGFWALPIAVAVVWYLGQWPEVRRAVASPRNLAILTLTSFLIVFNWGFYVWSIGQGRTLESSLGYFINPLLNVVMGYLFLGERFTTAQKLALALTTVAVLVQTIALGHIPWLGLMLAVTFCLYGFLRKTIPVGPTQGFLIEVAIIAALFTTLFLGGYNLPWLTDAGFVFPGGTTIELGHGAVVTIQVVTFLAKVFLLCSFQILIRWSLPRFRWDQVLRFAWKFMFPLALANLVVTVVFVWALG